MKESLSTESNQAKLSIGLVLCPSSTRLLGETASVETAEIAGLGIEFTGVDIAELDVEILTHRGRHFRTEH